MNYLAHLFFAQDNRESVVGNLMGDFLRGVDRSQLPLSIELGIKNHLEVDKFTDSHPIISELKPLFSVKYRRFAPVILDITFDYLLSQNWSLYSSEPRKEFISRVEKSLEESLDLMPYNMAKMVTILLEYDIFNSYNSISGLTNALDRTAARLRTFYGSINEVEPLLPVIDEKFKLFFPQLIEHIENQSIEKI
jgi:acyl carrier protein phosphodiesterase